MEILHLLCIVSVAFTGLTKGAGVLPDGPLIAAVGDTVMFNTTLTPTNKPVHSVSWKFGDRDIISLTSANVTAPEYEGRITLFISTGSLELRNVALNDSGEYKASITPDRGSAEEGSIRLNVSEPVSNVKATANTTDLVELSSVRLSCSSSGSSLSFLWLNDTSEVTESDRFQLTDGGSTLTILSVTRYDQGPFSCRVSNPVSNGTSDPVKLSIFKPVSNVKATANTTDLVEFSSSVRLSCSSSGSSRSVLWLNDTSEVTESDRVQLTDGNSTLIILNVTRYDQGPFRCHVSNPVSNGTSDPVKFFIIYGPENTKLTISPSKEYFEEGSDFTLSCSAVSNPAAQFYWFLNETKLPDTGPELKLINIHMNQSGHYSCQAFNNKTGRYETSQPSVVSVLGRISGASVTPSTKLTIEGNSVNLTCDAAGSVFTREWMKVGSNQNLTDNIILYHENRVLSFISLNKSDSGEYSCNISNPINSEEARYTMVVNYGPDNVHITGPSEIHLGETLILTCSADSTPSAGFTWMLNGTEIHNSAVFTKENTELSDSGNYTCQAMNNITEGTSSAVHILAVTDTPCCPSSCSAGCIAGIVVACLVVLVAALVAGYFIHKKGKCTKKSSGRNNTRMGQDNTDYSSSQELQYADVRVTKNKQSGTVQMGSENYSSTYAEIRVNNSPLAASTPPPTYDAHMQRMQTTAPQRYANVPPV